MSVTALETIPVVAESRAVLHRHARSFRWGAALLPAEARDDAAVVYAFCRLADDLADERPEPTPPERRTAALAALDLLEAELREQAPPRPLVAAFLHVCRVREIPLGAALHLVDGIRSDLDAVRLPDDAAIVRYGYRVAGTVGLMMCGVLGVRDPAATPHAIDLGVAMQITNICRDVLEDAHRGRVYLPESRLRAEGLSPSRLLAGKESPDPELRAGVRTVVEGLLDLAERYYASGFAGLRYIPLRARLGIRVAATLYRAIGRRLVNRHGADPLRGRTIVGPIDKVVLTSATLLRSLVPSASTPHSSDLHRPLDGLPGARPA